MISKAVKRLRVKLLLTQSEFASILGVTRYCISNYELGRRSPRLQIVGKMLSVAREHKIEVNEDDFVNE